MSIKRYCSAVLLMLAIGCAGKAGAPAAKATSAPLNRSSDIISQSELLDPAVNSGTALEAVRRLRPRFLATRGNGSIRTEDAGTVHVSLDGGPLQTVSFLSRMRPSEIAEIRYLNASQAAQKFGTLSGTGAVMLIKSR